MSSAHYAKNTFNKPAMSAPMSRLVVVVWKLLRFDYELTSKIMLQNK